MNDINKLSYEEWNSKKKYFDLKTGIRIAYIETGNLKGDNLIFIHGYSDSSMAWQTFLKFFSDKYHIFAVDLRGHGSSSRPRQFAYMPTQYAEDVAELIKHLDLRNIHIVGHSLGSIVGQILGFIIPDRISKMVLISTFGQLHETEESIQATLDEYSKYEKRVPTTAEMIPRYKYYANQQVVENYMNGARNWSENSSYCWKTAWLGMCMEDHSKFLQYIKAPILMIWGGLDPLVTEEYREEMKELLPAAHCKLYKENGHEVPQEDPENISNDIINFFDN